jgi:RND family efflux transporter MFP subunit
MSNEMMRETSITQEEMTVTPEQKPIEPRRAMLGVALVLLVFALLAAYGIYSRMHAATVLAEQTKELALPTVLVAPPKPGAPVDSFVLPGNVTAFTDSPIYARTSGYLTRWYFDIGAKVKKGALLAEIATPEVDEQLRQAEADLATAVANAANAKTQAERYTGLVKSNAVSKQDTDVYVSQAEATAAAVHSAEANVQRLRDLKSFEKVYAPFDGVVTARNVDTGQLIDPGAGRELFHLQAIETLRVYANLPQGESGSVKVGDQYELTFVEHPGKSYMGKLVRTADALDPVSRTLLVELDVENHKGELLPGSLAQVHFKTPAATPALIVPVSALIFRHEGMQVATVHGSVAHLASVVIGEDDGQSVQIIDGLNANDRVIQDPPDSLIEGEQVRIVGGAEGGK